MNTDILTQYYQLHIRQKVSERIRIPFFLFFSPLTSAARAEFYETYKLEVH